MASRSGRPGVGPVIVRHDLTLPGRGSIFVSGGRAQLITGESKPVGLSRRLTLFNNATFMPSGPKTDMSGSTFAGGYVPE